jgi:hypothetical protein
MPIPEDFAAESMYAPDGWFVHDILEVDREGRRLVALVDTTRLGPLVDAQRPWPGHERHFPGAVAIQITGTLAQLHAVYVLDMRATDGWLGYGTHIHKARFLRLGRVGPPVQASCVVTRVRNVRGTVFVDYDYEYTQDGAVIYESHQTAAWVRSEHRGSLNPAV